MERILKVTGFYRSFYIMLKDIYKGLGMHNRPFLKISKLWAEVKTRLGPIKKPLPLMAGEFDGVNRIHPMQL